MSRSLRLVFMLMCGFLWFEALASQDDPPPRSSPGATWSTLLGGSHWDALSAVAWMPASRPDASELVVAVGSTGSADFPTTPGAHQRRRVANGTTDAFVSVLRIAPDGTQQLLCSTFLGGTDNDYATDVAVDPSGRLITVAGWTRSADFPASPNALQPSYGGGLSDAFLAKLECADDGALRLQYATFLGGSQDDFARSLILDQAWRLAVVGETASPDFPTTPGALRRSLAGGFDVFMAQLDLERPGSEALRYATFLGGGLDDFASSIALDPTGLLAVTGWTWSTDFPTSAGAFKPDHRDGATDAFAALIAPQGSGQADLRYSTYLGGSSFDIGRAIAVELHGAMVIVGNTESRDMPMSPGAVQRLFGGGFGDAFLARIVPAGGGRQDLRHATYLGGLGDDVAWAVAVDSAGASTLAGSTTSADFPTTPGAWDPVYHGGQDAFVSRISPDASALWYSTFLGGGGSDPGWGGLALAASGAVVVAGETTSPEFPTTPGAVQRALNSPPNPPTEPPPGQSITPDGFMTNITMLPRGIGRFGCTSRSAQGPMALNALDVPRPGHAVRLTITNAPPNSQGALLIATQRGFDCPAMGIDPRALIAVRPIASDTSGFGMMSLAIPVEMSPGAVLYLTSLWPNCPGMVYCFSHALELTLQR